jgi:hypothetical protein
MDQTLNYMVSADIRYLDGALAEIVIPSGYRVGRLSIEAACLISRWIEKTRAADDFARAAYTGNRYQFQSAPRVEVESHH